MGSYLVDCTGIINRSRKVLYMYVIRSSHPCFIVFMEVFSKQRKVSLNFGTGGDANIYLANLVLVVVAVLDPFRTFLLSFYVGGRNILHGGVNFNKKCQGGGLVSMWE